MRTMVALTLAVLAMDQSPGPPQFRRLDDPEAVAVYARVLVGNSGVTGDHVTPLVLQQQTTTKRSQCAISVKASEADWRAVLDDYRLQNVTARSLPSTMSLGLLYVMPSESDLHELFSNGWWPAFYARFPQANGYVSLSAVGFDAPKTRAMVYVAHYCGGLCGGGAYNFLEKKGGSWQRVKPEITTCTWES